MSRKNRNARRQSAKPLTTRGIQMSMNVMQAPEKNTGVVRMLDDKCGYEFARSASLQENHLGGSQCPPY